MARRGEFKRAISEGALVPYPPMPPLVGVERRDGRTERALAVGLLPQASACAFSGARVS